MEYDSDVLLLSPKFMQDYPPSQYPELMYKLGRPYTCLLIDSHDDYFICVPFRSSIGHKNSFMFKGTARSVKSHSGLDYSKIVLVKDDEYLNSDTQAIVDDDEYTEMKKNLPLITKQVLSYVDTYINHVNGSSILHTKQFERKYKYSTLPYFHDILGLNS